MGQAENTTDADAWTSVAVKRETLRRLKTNLRGGESMDTLLRKMEAEYEPRTPIPEGA